MIVEINTTTVVAIKISSTFERSKRRRIRIAAASNDRLNYYRTVTALITE